MLSLRHILTKLLMEVTNDMMLSVVKEVLRTTLQTGNIYSLIIINLFLIKTYGVSIINIYEKKCYCLFYIFSNLMLLSKLQYAM